MIKGPNKKNKYVSISTTIYVCIVIDCTEKSFKSIMEETDGVLF